MAEPFVAEVRMFACNFAPRNWALCDGSIMAIRQNTALFSLVGTNFGGDGKVTFGLPNLQGTCVPGAGSGPGLTPLVVGETGGEATHTLSTTEMTAHSHNLMGQPPNRFDVANRAEAVGDALASPAEQPIYATGQTVQMANVLQPQGSGLPHNNMQPYLAINFCIALAGVFPPRP